MRVALALSLIPLAACGEGNVLDNEFRNTWREEDIKDCVKLDWSAGWTTAEQDETCRCAADRSMRESTTGELLTGEGAEKFEAAIQSCADEADERSR